MTGYRPDPDRICMEQFMDVFLSGKEPPGRHPVRREGKDRLNRFTTSGIRNLGDLVRVLRNPASLKDLALRTGLPPGYLRDLRKEADRWFTEPCPLSRFPGIPYEYAEALRSRGISNAGDFYEMACSAEHRNELALSTGIPKARLEELWELCDLSRIPGMTGVTARVAWEAGIRSVELYAATEAVEQYGRYMEIIKQRGFSTGAISVKSIGSGIRYARLLKELDSGNEGDK